MVYYSASKTYCVNSAYRHPMHYSSCDLNWEYCGRYTAAMSGVSKDSELPSGHACRILSWITLPFKSHMKGKQITEWGQSKKDFIFFNFCYIFLPLHSKTFQMCHRFLPNDVFMFYLSFFYSGIPSIACI